MSITRADIAAAVARGCTKNNLHGRAEDNLLRAITDEVWAQVQTSQGDASSMLATKTDLQPLDDRLVVEVNEAESKTPGGIVIPDSAKEKPQRGKVVAVGPGRVTDSGERIPLAVEIGDEVLFGTYAGQNIEIDGDEVKILRESEVLAIVR